MKPDLVVLGNLLVDDVVYDDGTTRMGQAGGAALYLALAARLFGLRVGLVTWRGDDYPEATLAALAERGVDLAGVHALGRPGLRTWLLYEGGVRRVVHRLEGPTHAEVSPTVAEIPASWRGGTAFFHLAPMPLAVQDGLVAGLGADVRISLDPYELVTEESLDVLRRLFSRVDVVFLSEDEMRLAGEPQATLAGLAGRRPRQLLYKRGERGGLLYEGGSFASWRGRAAEVVDPTGAGDAFAAGFLAAAARGEPPERGLQRGVVAASFALAGPGADGLLAATPERAEERLREWFGEADVEVSRVSSRLRGGIGP